MAHIPIKCLRNSTTRTFSWIISNSNSAVSERLVQERGYSHFIQQHLMVSGCRNLCDISSLKYPVANRRHFCDKNDQQYERGDNRDPWNMLKKDLSQLGATGDYVKKLVPAQTDVLIIGGGVTGLSTAFWLKHHSQESLNVVVLERDPTYTQASTVLSVGGIRQQFSLPENINMSLFGAEFLRNIKEHLSVLDLDPPDVCFTPTGYLFLATPPGAETLRNNHTVQIENKALVELMEKEDLKKRFPWLNVEDIELGTYGLQNEGMFDPWLLLAALKAKCLSLGVKFVTGDLVDFDLTHIPPGKKLVEKTRVENALVRNKADGKVYPIKAVYMVNCAGPWAQQVGRMAGIGGGEGPLGVPIPVEPRKRFVFMFHCPDGPGLDMPMLVDPSGVYLRREGLSGHYICGVSPQDDTEEPDISTLDVDYELFQEKIWPILANRMPVCEKLKIGIEEHESENNTVDKNIFNEAILPILESRIPAYRNAQVKSAWAGYYDYNTHDQNLIIGNHPVYQNFFMACGSSGHGLQHALAIGRAMSELLLEQQFVTIDLSAFSFDRVLYGEKLCEANIV